jgi:hypothetical protein
LTLADLRHEPIATLGHRLDVACASVVLAKDFPEITDIAGEAPFLDEAGGPDLSQERGFRSQPSGALDEHTKCLDRLRGHAQRNVIAEK